MSTLAIAGVSARRILRDRTSLFFFLVLPVLVILIIGATVRGFSTVRIAVVGGSPDSGLVAALRHDPTLEVHGFASREAASTAERRGEVSLTVVIPADADQSLRSGRAVGVTFLLEQSNTTQQAAAAAVESAISDYGARLQAAAFARAQSGGGYNEELQLATALQRRTPLITTRTVVADGSAQVLPEGFAYSAPTMLVLFVFINALAAGAAIIDTWRLRMYERMGAAPIRRRSVIVGESITYVGLAIVQSMLIVGIGATLFGVHWGNPLGASALVVVWSFVGAGAGILAGTVFRTPEQASSIGPAAGIVLGMLGGCMWPLSIVGGAMRTVGHITPHSWAVDAWTKLMSAHGTIVTIAPQLAVLATFAVALLVVSTIRLRRIVGW